jgi:hypothetical protein
MSIVDQLVPNNEHAPHKAVIWIKADVYEVTKTGECTGIPMYSVDTFPVYVDGIDRRSAIMRLNEKLEEIKKLCPAK